MPTDPRGSAASWRDDARAAIARSNGVLRGAREAQATLRGVRQILDGWWHVYDHDPRYRYVGRVAHVIVLGTFGEKTLCGRVWNLNRRDGDGYRKCAECLRRTEKANA